MWDNVNEYILIRIADFMDIQEIGRCSRVNRWWHYVMSTAIVWQRKLAVEFKIPKQKLEQPSLRKTRSWKSEFRRLHWQTPFVLSEEIHHHFGGISCLKFDPTGTYLASCGQDAMLYVYSMETSLKVAFQQDLSIFGWTKALHCSFNPDGSMLMVSGALPRDILGRIRGEILVFSVQESFQICAKINNNPPIAGGCWFNDKYLISSDFKWLSVSHKISASMLWMNKITPLNSENQADYTLACMRCLYKFYNVTANAVGQIMVVDAIGKLEDQSDSMLCSDEIMAREIAAKEFVSLALVDISNFLRERVLQEESRFIHYPEYHERLRESEELGINHSWTYFDEHESDDSESEWEYYDEETESLKPELIKVDEGFEVINDCDKLLIFTTGSKFTCVPHQVGVKKMSKVRFRKHMDLSKSLEERIAERRRKEAEERIRYQNMEPGEMINWQDYSSVSHMFDYVDILFDFPGRIVSLVCTPDSRFLYVSYQRWLTLDLPSSQPPPVKAIPDVIILDLVKNEVVGEHVNHEVQSIQVLHEINKLKPLDLLFQLDYIPDKDSNLCCQLAVSQDLLAAPRRGSEVDIWDRYFGIQISSLSHKEGSTITSTAISSSTRYQMAASGDDNGNLRLWKSKEQQSKLHL